MSHFQAFISSTIVYTVLQFLCLTVFCLSQTIAVPIAIVRLRQKTVRHKNCKTVCTIVLEMNA